MVTKFDEKMMPKWSPQIIKIEPLGAHGRVLLRCCEVLKVCFFFLQIFWIGKKSARNRTFQKCWRPVLKTTVLLFGVDGKGGVSGKRKSLGFED